jgi:hypothetical protein
VSPVDQISASTRCAHATAKAPSPTANATRFVVPLRSGVVSEQRDIAAEFSRAVNDERHRLRARFIDNRNPARLDDTEMHATFARLEDHFAVFEGRYLGQTGKGCDLRLT